MPTLSTLVVKLVTEHGDLIQGLEKSYNSVKKFVGDTEKSIKSLSLTDLKSGFELAGGALTKFGDLASSVYSETVGKTMEFAKQVRDLSTNIGASAEETSSMIQAADDAGISVETLTKSLEMAVKKGFQPNINNLAKLADEYVSIADPIERAARLNEVFGKGWAELTPLLKEGGTALRDAAESAKAMGLTLNDEDVEAARNLEIQIDNLNDKIESLKITAGKTVIPGLVQFGTALDHTISKMSGLVSESEELQYQLDQTTYYYGANSKEAMAAQAAIDAYNQKAKEIAMTDAETALRANMKAFQDVDTAAMAAAKDGLAAYYEAQRDGNANSQASVEAANNLRGAIDLVKDSTSKLTAEVIFAKAAKDLDAVAALELGLKLGVVDSETLNAMRAMQELRVKADSNRDGFIDAKEAANGYIDSIVGIAESQKLIERRVTIDVEIRRHGGEIGDVGEETGGGGGKKPASKPKTKTTPSGYPKNKADSLAMGGPTGAGGWKFLHPNEWVLNEAQRFGRVPIPSEAVPALGRGGTNYNRTTITTNNFYDTLTARMVQEDERFKAQKSVREMF